MAVSDFFATRLRVFRELFTLTQRSGRWWILPLMLVLIILGTALAGLTAVQFLSPFVYAVL